MNDHSGTFRLQHVIPSEILALNRKTGRDIHD